MPNENTSNNGDVRTKERLSFRLPQRERNVSNQFDNKNQEFSHFPVSKEPYYDHRTRCFRNDGNGYLDMKSEFRGKDVCVQKGSKYTCKYPWKPKKDPPSDDSEDDDDKLARQLLHDNIIYYEHKVKTPSTFPIAWKHWIDGKKKPEEKKTEQPRKKRRSSKHSELHLAMYRNLLDILQSIQDTVAQPPQVITQPQPQPQPSYDFMRRPTRPRMPPQVINVPQPPLEEFDEDSFDSIDIPEPQMTPQPQYQMMPQPQYQMMPPVPRTSKKRKKNRCPTVVEEIINLQPGEKLTIHDDSYFASEKIQNGTTAINNDRLATNTERNTEINSQDSIKKSSESKLHQLIDSRLNSHIYLLPSIPAESYLEPPTITVNGTVTETDTETATETTTNYRKSTSKANTNVDTTINTDNNYWQDDEDLSLTPTISSNLINMSNISQYSGKSNEHDNIIRRHGNMQTNFQSHGCQTQGSIEMELSQQTNITLETSLFPCNESYKDNSSNLRKSCRQKLRRSGRRSGISYSQVSLRGDHYKVRSISGERKAPEAIERLKPSKKQTITALGDTNISSEATDLSLKNSKRSSLKSFLCISRNDEDDNYQYRSSDIATPSDSLRTNSSKKTRSVRKYK